MRFRQNNMAPCLAGGPPFLHPESIGEERDKEVLGDMLAGFSLVAFSPHLSIS